MIEVMFGESEAGAMKCAKSRKAIISGEDGPTAVFGNADLLPSREAWIPIPGHAGEVICLAYMLDIGDIRETFDSKYRQELILSMYLQSGWNDSQEYINELREGIQRNIREYCRLLDFIQKGEQVRIWYSQTPYSLCGLYWLCRQMNGMENEVYAVEMPSYTERSDGVIVVHHSWGNVEAEKFSSFLKYQRRLSEAERRMLGCKWTELLEDNSPLRAVVNGELVGVPEDFYDFLILREITETPVKEARLIGDILGKYPLQVGDCWYASRIEQMIKDGRIKVVQGSEQKYTQMLYC
ncbi:DUF3658 domain-containing protein [Lachnospiraceae bacterium 46-15]